MSLVGSRYFVTLIDDYTAHSGVLDDEEEGSLLLFPEGEKHC